METNYAKEHADAEVICDAMIKFGFLEEFVRPPMGVTPAENALSKTLKSLIASTVKNGDAKNKQEEPKDIKFKNDSTLYRLQTKK